MAVLVQRRERWLWGAFTGLVFAALIARWWLGGEVPPAPPMPAPPRDMAATPLVVPPVPATAMAPVSTAADEEVAEDVEAAGEPALVEREVGIELQAIAEAIQEYHRALGPLPSGANATITAALTGANERRLSLLPANHPAIQNGQLTDAWGTPYQILPNLEGSMEVRSAGADRMTGTDDDESWTVATAAESNLAVDERLITAPPTTAMPPVAEDEASQPTPEQPPPQP